MSDALFVAGDLSGIQAYVLNVSTAGGGQARRLRARSFFVQVVEELAARAVLEAFRADWEEACIFHGGGQFLLRLPEAERADERLSRLCTDLESGLRSETQGQLGLTLAWGVSVEEALRRKEWAKRRPWASTLTREGSWQVASFRLDPLIPHPCEICGLQAATRRRRDGGEEISICRRCYDDGEIGKRLPAASRLELDEGGEFEFLGRRVRLNVSPSAGHGDSLRVAKLHVPDGMTFEEIAGQATGDDLLAVLKADVDAMGAKLAEVRGNLEALKQFSRALDGFFSRQVQDLLTRQPWHIIYTIYSGGDDLLLVGPWNLILDFVGEVHRKFAEGPGRQYGLTFSAGVALTNYRIPIRHAVEQTEALLGWAKGRSNPAGQAPAPSPKDCCAALGGLWKWGRHADILNAANKIKSWIDTGVCPRSMAQRLLALAEGTNPLRTAHWAYEVGRNFPKAGSRPEHARSFRAWGEQVLANVLEDPVQSRELAVELRYALTATRPRRKEP
jgi:CRISPR-associated protein Csm1